MRSDMNHSNQTFENENTGFSESPREKTTDAYIVGFKGNRRDCYLNSSALHVNIGDYMVVQAERGEDYGLLLRKACGTECIKRPEMLRILRQGSDFDLDRLAFNRQKESETFQECQKFVAKHRLKMKLVDVEYQFDCNKITIFFTAEKRVDFRELVKDLAATYRTRIELRQIGVRDEAKRLDGFGICGQRQCCSNWLGDFCTITTQMARSQNLALNPQKLSGNCGRLLCCLKYEMNFYEEVSPQYPPLGARCATKNGQGQIRKVDIFKEQISVILEDGSELIMSLAELKRARNRGQFKVLESPAQQADYGDRELDELQG